MTNSFPVKVEQAPAYHVAGLSVVTSMEAAFKDCSGLWENKFSQRMKEFSLFPGISFGISQYIDENSFKYIAALPLAAGEAAPQGMEIFDIPAGLYASVELNSLQKIGEVYSYLCSQWPGIKDYEFLFSPSYEIYPADHLTTGKLSIYMPVKKK